MPHPSIEEIAKRLGFSTSSLRVYIRRKLEAVRHSAESQPTGALRTMQGQPENDYSRATVHAETVEQDENKLYEQWKTAPHGHRTRLEQQLFNRVIKHATAVVWIMLKENPGQLPRDIASDVLRGLDRFEGRSKFSTWVQAIAIKKINAELKRRISDRKRFTDDFEEHQPERESHDALERLNARLLRNDLAKGLTSEKVALLDGLIGGASPKELAKKFGITLDATESRIRRLRLELRQKNGLKRRN